MPRERTIYNDEPPRSSDRYTKTAGARTGTPRQYVARYVTVAVCAPLGTTPRTPIALYIDGWKRCVFASSCCHAAAAKGRLEATAGPLMAFITLLTAVRPREAICAPFHERRG